MADFDVFNGDADGICALVQLRRAEPRNASLITGVKRDISLLRQVDAGAGDRVTVLDISMRNNAEALGRLLDAGADIFYADHHNPGVIPNHIRLEAHIDTDADSCTSLIVDRLLGGRFRLWAITAAYGDGLAGVADRTADADGVPTQHQATLQSLGTLINYNGYGAEIADLHFAPEDLYRAASQFDSPLDFVEQRPDVCRRLQDGYDNDMAEAERAMPVDQTDGGLVLELPDLPSSRRVSGVYGNHLADLSPSRAHALLTRKAEGGWVVSVRAPKQRREGADALCLQFETGGGRAGAAGINHLSASDLDRFVEAFRDAYSNRS